MLSHKSLTLLGSLLATLTAASLTPSRIEATHSWIPGTLNNTQEFYIQMQAIKSPSKYDGYNQAWHTGAGFADPVFVPASATGTRSYLNGTQLQFDVGPFPFAAGGSPYDTNYARWEPVRIFSGYGDGKWTKDWEGYLVVDEEDFDGWLVCEWVHGVNLPQLFELVKGFDGGEGVKDNVPCSCVRINLTLQYI